MTDKARAQTATKRSKHGAPISPALYQGRAPGPAIFLQDAIARYHLRQQDFLAVIDGMEMDVAEDIRAPDLATLDLYCDRVASAVGRLSIKVFGMEEDPGFALAYPSRPRAATDEHSARSRRGRRHRPALSAARISWLMRVFRPTSRGRPSARPLIDKACRIVAARAHDHYREASRILAKHPKGRIAAPRLMGAVYSGYFPRWSARAGRPRARAFAGQGRASPHRFAPRIVRMTLGTTYVIGAGLSGLSAATALVSAGRKVELIEAADQAGGRCRSYFDSTLGRVIDNGNHLVLSGNHATFDYLRTIGAENGLIGPDRAEFTFADLVPTQRWTITPNDGPFAWWVLSQKRRVPGTRAGDYLGLTGLLFANRKKRVQDAMTCKGVLWERLLDPFLLAALNTKPEIGSAALAGAIVRETLAKGGRALSSPHRRAQSRGSLHRPCADISESKGCGDPHGAARTQICDGAGPYRRVGCGRRDTVGNK